MPGESTVPGAATVIRSAEARRVATPNAAMTTLVSPTHGDSPQALWRVEAAPGATGPTHTNDRPQVWTILTGAATVDIAGEQTELAAGDTVVIPSGVSRRVLADTATGYTAICMGPADARVTAGDRGPIPLPWAE
ncbi:cupin domain-containing protein [Yinghuangia sp. ASG 101]|uniref:cupin domain-containing protein n=1 Tax=Yinghuangia sp. ASG 101 TaxID=2896848 RepID=UPI001E3C1BE0|nr:cupin domain-containing protein [Yinghuangia sp. ASG 101]UGQ09008.1 cupin domain-containing protein [Yinghuangia sp. ASG 101]